MKDYRNGRVLGELEKLGAPKRLISSLIRSGRLTEVYASLIPSYVAKIEDEPQLNPVLGASYA